MSMRSSGYSPGTPNGGGMSYGGGGPPSQQQMYNSGVATPSQQMLPPGAYNRGSRMEHVANNTLSSRSFGTVLPANHKESDLNSGVVRQIQMDWDNRQYLEAITLGIKKIADFLNKFNLSCQTRLAFLNERLSHLERQLDYIQAKVPKAASNQSHA